MPPLCLYCHERPAKRLPVRVPKALLWPEPIYFCGIRCAAKHGIHVARLAAIEDAKKRTIERIAEHAKGDERR